MSNTASIRVPNNRNFHLDRDDDGYFHIYGRDVQTIRTNLNEMYGTSTTPAPSPISSTLTHAGPLMENPCLALEEARRKSRQMDPLSSILTLTHPSSPQPPHAGSPMKT